MHAQAQRGFALVGPGRAGTTIALALVGRGWTAVGVAGRDPESGSALDAAVQLGTERRSAAEVARGAELVIVATPDAAIADAASAIGPALEPGALVVHLSGACTLDELDKLRLARPDTRVGSLHPLQSLPSPAVGTARLAGSWCAVDGPDDVDRLARSLGMRPFRVDPARRAAYHAAACVASNHLVALLGQVSRLAESASVPPEALLPLVRATVDNVESLGAPAALTGPVARGDVDTVVRHLDALPADEHDTYRSLASAALRLSGRDDDAMVAALKDAR